MTFQQKPACLYNELKADGMTFTIVWDTGCTQAITFCEGDFEGPITKPKTPLILGGLAKGLPVAGEGLVNWTFLADNGKFMTLKMPCYYVPEASQRLLSPQHLIQQNGVEATGSIEQEGLIFKQKGMPPLTIRYDG